MHTDTSMELEREMAEKLSVLRDAPARPPEVAARGRAAFLAQAGVLAEARQPAVSGGRNARHIGWMQAVQAIFPTYRKERMPMFGTLGTIVLILSLVLSGGGATVAAAQHSMPDSALYGLKTWSEQLRAGLAAETQQRFALALERADRRAAELQYQLRAGQAGDAVGTQARLQAEIGLALGLAAGQPYPQAAEDLALLRDRLREQDRDFAQLGPLADPQHEAIRDQVRAMLRDHQQDCADGIADPDALRIKLRDRDQDQLRDRDPQAPGAGTGPQRDRLQDRQQITDPQSGTAGEPAQQQEQLRQREQQLGEEPEALQQQEQLRQREQQPAGQIEAQQQEQQRQREQSEGQQPEQEQQGGPGAGGQNGQGDCSGCDGSGPGGAGPGGEDTGGSENGGGDAGGYGAGDSGGESGGKGGR